MVALQMQAFQKWALGVAAVLLTMGLFFYAHDFYLVSEKTAPPSHIDHGDKAPVDVPKGFPELVQELWKPLIHPIDSNTFVTSEGYNYEIPANAHRWTKPLGKKLLILDVDTRIHDGPGDMMNQDPLYFKNMTGRTAGWMNHYLYALVHGYDYRLVRAPDYPDRHGTWVKVPMIREALKTHDFVVFLDADAVFMYHNLPFEWLMSLWGVTPNTLLAMAEDPNSKTNQDDKGRVLWNTGFVIGQASERTQEIMNIWDRCPTGEKYEKCGHWAKNWAHEQAAFGQYIRYDYNSTEELRAIPCMDGNGAPYIGDKKCGGVFVRHHWFRKDAPAGDLKDQILEMMIRRMHGHFHSDQKQYFLDAHEATYPLDVHV